jgi:hypothetical protein
VTDVNLQTAIKVLRMNAFGPAIPEFFRQRASGELEPRPIEPDAELVFTRDPVITGAASIASQKRASKPPCGSDGIGGAPVSIMYFAS